jgi:YegS/Rv2252/BmrU family lipid kinase
VNIAVIINPTAGPVRKRRPPHVIEAEARRLVEHAGGRPLTFLSERPGHASSLARQALSERADVVVAWGGDGTVNEVASVLAGRGGVMGIVPIGSGNGLARDLRIPARPAAAIEVAMHGRDRILDAGELDGRLFFNIAGMGFDAHIAEIFARANHARGFGAYAFLVVREFFRYHPATYRIVTGGGAARRRALFVTAANTRQWGNGVVIAPRARPDDGLLDLVVADARAPLLFVANVWRLFAGRIDRMQGVTVEPCRSVLIEATPAAPVHIDGEPVGHVERVHIRVVPAAIRVRVPGA